MENSVLVFFILIPSIIFMLCLIIAPIKLIQDEERKEKERYKRKEEREKERLKRQKENFDIRQKELIKKYQREYDENLKKIKEEIYIEL